MVVAGYRCLLLEAFQLRLFHTRGLTYDAVHCHGRRSCCARLPYHSLNKAGQPKAQRRMSEYDSLNCLTLSRSTPQAAIVGMQLLICLRAFTPVKLSTRR